jgi:hypothetical protein
VKVSLASFQRRAFQWVAARLTLISASAPAPNAVRSKRRNRGYKADMSHRIACSDRLMNRAFGLPVQVTNENIVENRKQILEVRWMAPDPNDHSKLIEPEPD